MTHKTNLPDQDAQKLQALDAKPWPMRTLGYLHLMGPGFMQSAMTLGGGTAFASIFAGAAFGYDLLWVAPVAMALGIIVLAAVAHQTLSVDQDPFAAMKQYAGAPFAWGWAISGIVSSIIWQFAQYALAAAMLKLMAAQLGWDAPLWSMGLIALAWCVCVAMLYGRAHRFVRLYEAILKGMVWLIVIALAWVVARTGIPNPGELLGGLVPNIPAEYKGVSGLTVVVSGLAAAVGANMVFVYPYTLRRRNWGPAHRRLARLDLGFGMFVPYVLAAGLLLIASASIFHFQSPELFDGKKITPWACAQVLAAPDRLGPTVGLWVFSLGVLAMALSSITMQMLCSGFALSVMCNKPTEGPTYRIGMLLPAVGVLGAIYWSDVALWVAVPTNIICGLLLPIAYIGFILLQRNRRYLGDAMPAGVKGTLWIAGMCLSTLVLVVFLVWFAIAKLPGWFQAVT
ncbi:MAG: divalent metal cation transporter [Phycisphaerales bacterium]|nr:divalent metal cation transporter [Phycisphaerales bacterium]